MNTIFIVAHKEFRDGLRNRWVLAISVMLGLLAIGIAYFGAAASGSVGFTSLPTTIVSLSSLAVFLIPLIALLLAYDAVVGEQQQGTLLLLLTYPLQRRELLLGKFLGHGLILAVATLLGFGVAGMVIAVSADTIEPAELFQSLGLFILSAILLGWVFVALAYLVSTVVVEKSRAAGLALLVWFAFVLVFDLILLALLIGADAATAGSWLPYLLLLNPADCFRLVNLTGFEAAQAYSGLMSIASEAIARPSLLLGALSLWIAAPLALAVWLFGRRQI
ncbi:MAG TPA: ABC transporter permease subunit [Gammaproteobacteria bacterium]|nr:ABC transporter permease subunit [Gammaproteobacteria bacterium]